MTTNLTGTSSADTMLGSAGDDIFMASAGDDRIWGGSGGNDTLVMTGRFSDYTIRDNGNGSFTISDLREGGDGIDVVRAINTFVFADQTLTLNQFVTLGVNNDITGTSGADVLVGTSQNDRFEGGSGDDRIWGGSNGSDLAIYSGAASDYIIRDNGNGSYTITDLRGVDGVDIIRDIEQLQFSDGTIVTEDFVARMPNEVAGTAGNDQQLGSAGNDRFLSSAGDDRIWGGTGGDDVLVYSGKFSEYAITENRDGSCTVRDMRTGAPDGVDVVRDITTFQFSDRHATLAEFVSAHPNNYVFDGQGSAANDILIGSSGNDFLQGGGGNDRIWGGNGGDDTAVFDGDFSNYEITDNDNGVFTVKDLRAGSRDGTVDVAQIVDGANPLVTTLRGTAADDTMSGAHTDGLFDAHTNDLIIGNAGVDLIRGGPGDDVLYGDGTATVAEHTFTSNPETELPRFIYEPGLFQAINGQLMQLDPQAGTYQAIGPDHPNYNAAGLNPFDGYAYGVGTGGDIRGHLLRIGSDGNYESLGSGYPAVAAGGIGGDGRLYLLTGVREMTVINVETLEREVVMFDGQNPSRVHDLVFVSSDEGGTFYGVTINAVLVAYDMTDHTVSTASIDGKLTGKGAYGAGWTSSDGGLYFSHNTTGNIYGISGVENMNPAAALLSVGGTSSTNDGFSFGDVGLPAELVVEGSDMLLGGAGSDTLYGGEGNDFLDGGKGADVLYGGAGLDTADYSRAADGVVAALETGGFAGEAEGDIYVAVENLLGSRHDDILTGDANSNEITGGAGNDTIIGGVGNDVLRGEEGADQLDGGDGYDIATYFYAGEGVAVDLAAGTGFAGEAYGDTLTGIEALQGSNIGEDTLFGSAAEDGLYGFGGNDILDGRNGDDILHGGGGDDTLYGGAGEDLLLGQDGADHLDGGNDNIQGGNGVDSLLGGAGTDRLWGADGNDVLEGGSGDDFLRGGEGADTFRFSDGGGNDTIMDFVVGLDSVDLSGVSGIEGWDDLTVTMLEPANASAPRIYDVAYLDSGVQAHLQVQIDHSQLSHPPDLAMADFLF